MTKLLNIFITFSLIVLMAAPLYSQRLLWQPMRGMHASNPTSLAVTPNGMLYTACVQENGYPGGFFRSTDHGNSWRFLGTFRPNYIINGMLGVTDNILLANFDGNTEYFGTDFDTLGIYRSQDSGKTWKLVLTGDAAAFGHATIVGIGGGNIIIKADSDYYSSDLGMTWKRFRPTFTPDAEIFVPVSAGVLSYNNSALYLSRDFQSWNIILTPKPSNYFRNVEQLPDGTLAVFSDSLYLSSDFGLSWISRPLNYKTEFGSAAPLCFLSDGTLIGYVTSVDPYRSSDSGQTWTRVIDVSQEQNLAGGRLFCTDAFSNAFFGRDEYQEIIRVSDTSTSDVECSPTNLEISRLAATTDGYLAAGTLLDPGISMRFFTNFTTDGGSTWYNLFPINEAEVVTMWLGYHRRVGFAAEILTPYLSNQPSSFMHSPDGLAWGEITPLPFSGILSGFDNEGDIFISDGSVTTDRGTTWLQHETPPGQVVGLPDGSCVSGGLFRSTDIGVSWHSSLTSVSGNVRTIACDSSGNIMVGTDAGMFLTKDVGKSWMNVSAGLPADSGLRQICYSTEGFWLAATAFGVFTLNKDDTVWKLNSDGLDDPDILCIDVGGPGKYYVGTSHAGIYKTEGALSGISSAKSPFHRLELETFPNPFSQSTQITFSSASAGYADISIVNLLGEQVAHVFSGNLDAGLHNFTFGNTASLPGGMYECLVRMNGRVEKQPMVLLH